MDTIRLISKGTAVLGETSITIDDARTASAYRGLLLAGVLGSMFFGAELYRSSPEEGFLYWSFLVLLIMHLLVIGFSLRYSWAKVIQLEEVREAKLTTRSNALVLRLKLKRGRVRVLHVEKDSAPGLRTFVETNFPA